MGILKFITKDTLPVLTATALQDPTGKSKLEIAFLKLGCLVDLVSREYSVNSYVLHIAINNPFLTTILSLIDNIPNKKCCLAAAGYGRLTFSITETNLTYFPQQRVAKSFSDLLEELSEPYGENNSYLNALSTPDSLVRLYEIADSRSELKAFNDNLIATGCVITGVKQLSSKDYIFILYAPFPIDSEDYRSVGDNYSKLSAECKDVSGESLLLTDTTTIVPTRLYRWSISFRSTAADATQPLAAIIDYLRNIRNDRLVVCASAQALKHYADSKDSNELNCRKTLAGYPR